MDESRVKAAGLVYAAAALSLLLVVGVLSFAGPCVHDDGTTGVCASAGNALAVEGAVMLACCVVGSLMRKKPVLVMACCIVSAVVGVVGFFTPGTILPLCMMETMRCWTLMAPFAKACCALVAVLCLVQCIVARK